MLVQRLWSCPPSYPPQDELRSQLPVLAILDLGPVRSLADYADPMRFCR